MIIIKKFLLVLVLLFTITSCSSKDKTQYKFNESVKINEEVSVIAKDDIANKEFVFEYDSVDDKKGYYFTFVLDTRLEKFEYNSTHLTITCDDKKVKFNRENRYFFDGDTKIKVAFDDYVLGKIKENDNRYVVQASNLVFAELNK